MGNPNSKEGLPMSWAEADISYRKAMWDSISRPGAISYLEARETVLGMLNTDLVSETLALRGDTAGLVSVVASDYQQGEKNGIFLVTATTQDRQHDFVLVISKGNPGLNEEVEADFTNLGNVRSELGKNGLPLFVPQVYALSHENGIAGFSVERLTDHTELNPYPVLNLRELGFNYTYFIANTSDRNLARFNTDMKAAYRDMAKGFIINGNKVIIRAAAIQAADFYIKNQRIKKEMIARLRIVHALTGAVPSEFSPAAGDFMFKPFADDFDLRLITIRGGFTSLQANLFSEWAISLLEDITFTDDTTIQYPLFDRNPSLIQEGIQLGDDMIEKGDVSI